LATLAWRYSTVKLIAAAMRMWEQGVIEAALGEDAARVLPEAIRLVLLRARVPRYQRDMLVALAKRHGTTVDDVLACELEGVASAHAEELAGSCRRLVRLWRGRARRDALLRLGNPRSPAAGTTKYLSENALAEREKRWGEPEIPLVEPEKPSLECGKADRRCGKPLCGFNYG
jgi:hypothetical protein